MAFFSISEFTADGVSDIVPVPFPYLLQAHVHVLLDGVQVDDAELTWTSSSTIQLPSVPIAGALVRVFRSTPLGDPNVVFQPGPFSHRDLNREVLQLLYAEQEGADADVEAGSGGGGGVTDHGGLTGLGDDDHPQYLLASGLRPMSGTLDMGAQSIQNVGTVDGRDVSSDGLKLDGIEAGADVTDPLNVAASGAVMDGDFGVNGLMARSAAGTYASRTIAGPPAGIAVTDGDGAAGNPTLALANDLGALEGLAGTGIAARTAADAWAQRSVDGTAPISVTNGDGVSGNPTVALDDGGVTNAKLADVATDTIKGRTAAGTGDPEDLTATQARAVLNVEDGANNYAHPNHTGDVTSVGDGATTIVNDAVTNAKLANMAPSTIKGRASGAGTGDATDLSDAQARTVINGQVVGINNQTASYTLVLGDKGGYIRMNAASANNLTVPANSSVAFPVGSVVVVRQVGAGQTTVVEDTGVTVTPPHNGTLSLSGQGAQAAIIKVGTDAWELSGQVEAVP